MALTATRRWPARLVLVLALVAALVLPPQAGHDSCIVDFQPRQSQMMTIREAGLTRAFTLDWVGATAATSKTTVSDFIAVVDRAVEHCRDATGRDTGVVKTNATEASGTDAARTVVAMMASLRAIEAGQKALTTIDESLGKANTVGSIRG